MNEEQKPFSNSYLTIKTSTKNISDKNCRSLSENKRAKNFKKIPYNLKNNVPSPKTTNKREEITARFNQSPLILKDQNKNWSELKEPQNSKDDKVKNLIEILYNKINSVADSTKKFLNSAEKLSRYCEFSKNEAKLDLRNYQSEKSNIESELNNLSSELNFVDKNNKDDNRFSFEKRYLRNKTNNAKSSSKEERKKSNEKIKQKPTKFQTPPSRERENHENKVRYDVFHKYPQNKTVFKEFSKTTKLDEGKIKSDVNQSLYTEGLSLKAELNFFKKENEFLKGNLKTLTNENQVLKETNHNLTNYLNEYKENNAKIVKKYKDKKNYNKKLMDLLKLQGGEDEYKKIKKNFDVLMKTEIPKEINLKNIEDIIKKAEVDLNTIKLQITKGNDKENCKTNKTKLLELRRKKKEAENLLFNEKITKEQYNNLLEILKAIQIEEKDLEEKSKFSLSHQDFNDFNYVNGPLANLETIILTFKENFSNLILETKLLRKKLKQVKLEKKASEDENNCNFTKLESFYQIEFSKILQKIEDIENDKNSGKSKEITELSNLRYSLGEIVEKFKIPVEMEEEALKNNNNDLTIQEYLQVIEKALSKNQQMKNQSEEIYLRHIKNLQKECKSLQNQTLQYEMENKNLSSTVEILTNEQFQQNLVDLTKELELKNNEIFQLKFELDKQNSENENELLKIKKEFENEFFEREQLQSHTKELESFNRKIQKKLDQYENDTEIRNPDKKTEEEISRLRQKVSDLNSELSHIKTENLTKKSEFDQMKIFLQSKKEENKAYSQEKQQLEQNLKEKEVECLNLTTQMQDIRSEANKMKENLVNLQRTQQDKQKIQELENKILENEGNFMQLQKKYLQNEKNLREKENELRKILNAFNSSKEEIQRLQNENNENQRQYEENLGIYQKNEMESQEMFESLQGQLNEKANFMDQLELQCQNLLQEKSKLEILINEKKNSERNRNSLSLKEKEEFEELRKKFEQTQNYENKIVSEKSELEKKIKFLQKEFDQQNKKLKETYEKINNIEIQAKRIEMEKNNIQQKLENSEKVTKFINEENQKYQNENKEIVSKLNELQNNIDNEKDALINKKNDEIEEYKSVLDNQKELFEKQNLDLSENKKIINSKNGELSENRKLLNSQNDILQRIKSELNDFKILLNKKTNEIEQLRSELTQTIKLKHSETENLKNEILEKNQMLEFKEKETENLQKNLSDLKNSLKTQLNETEKPILELIETKQSLKAKNDEFEILQKDLFQIKNSLISKNEELEVLNEKLSHMQEYINLQESSQINDLNSIMNEKNQEIEILVKNFEDISKVYEEKTLENFALNEEKLELHEKTADMKNKIEEYEFILQTNEIRIKELEEQTGMLKSVRTEENSQRNNETPNFSQKQEEDFEHLKMINESLKKERDLMLQDFQFKYNEKERELQNLLSKNKNNFENIQEKDKYHETQISEMNFVIMDLKGNLLKKEEELSEIIMQKSKIEEINAQLEANFTNLQQSYNKILIKLKNKDEELSKLNIPEINGKDSQIITLKSLNADLCIQNDFLKKENQKLSIEAKTLSENLEQKSSKFETIQNTEPNSQEFNSLLARYELLSSEYQEINNIIREMIKEFFPSEDCPECHSTRTLLVRIQRIIRQKNEDNTIETNEEYNENPKKSKDDQEKMEDPEMFNNKNDEEELDMENELEEYRMIIKHLEIALKEKDKQINKMNKLFNGKELNKGLNAMNAISEKDEEEEEEKLQTKEKFENVDDTKYKFSQTEITRLNKENLELGYLNEQLNSNLERMQEEITDMQQNEEKFMMQIKLLKEEIDSLEKSQTTQNSIHEKEHIKSIFFRFLEEINSKTTNKIDIDNYLQLLFSLLGVTERDKDQHNFSNSFFKSLEKKKTSLNSFFKK